MMLLRNLYNDDRGATAIEYGLIAAMIVIAILVSLNAVAEGTVGMWHDVSTKIETAQNPVQP